MVSSYALIYLVAYMAPAFVGFLALILYTHLLSPAQYGVYVIGASIAGIISAVFFAWIRLSVSRYQARSPTLDLRAEAIISYCATVVVLAAIAPIAILIIHPDIGIGLIAGSLFLSLSLTAFEIGQEFKRARFNPLRFTTVALVRSGSGLVLGLLSIEFGGGGLGLLVAIAASFAIANVVNLQRDPAKPIHLPAAGSFAQFARYGLPFSLGAIAFALHGTLDRLVIAYLLGQSGAGNYAVCADLTRQLFAMLAASVASAMFPIAFRSLADSGPAATRARLAEGAELLLALIVPASVWLAISSNLVAGTLLGAEFRSSAATLLPLFAIGRMFGAYNQYYLQVSFQLAEKPLLQVAGDAAVLLLNLAFLIPMTLAFGLPGTAAAVVIAEALGVAIAIWLTGSAFRLPFNGRGMARVFASTSIMAVVTYAALSAFAGHGLATLLGVVASSGIAYAGSAVLFNVGGVRAMIPTLLRLRSLAAE